MAVHGESEGAGLYKMEVPPGVLGPLTILNLYFSRNRIHTGSRTFLYPEPHMNKFKSLSFAIVLAGTLCLGFLEAKDFELTMITQSAYSKLGITPSPTTLSLSAVRPALIRREPSGLSTPGYASLCLGPAEGRSDFLVILDSREDGSDRLFIDANANGDLTDDPPIDWKSFPIKTANASGPLMLYRAPQVLQVRFEEGSLPLSFILMRYKTSGDKLYYVGDYARSGQISVEDKTLPVVLLDKANCGDFRRPTDKRLPEPTLLIDLNGDGKFDPVAESFSLGEPFAVGQGSYVASTPSSSGTTLRIEVSSIPAVEKKAQVRGANVLRFTAKTTDEKTIDFPSSFKGRIVMIDFWATWCQPCLREMPNLSENFNKFKTRGFEVLGVSLDMNKSAEEIQRFARQREMDWPQIYEGGGWETRLAKMFDVHSIPKALLVDGDTGIILADTGLRGAALESTLEKFLNEKIRNKP